MARERLSVYVLGSRKNSHVEGDAYFQGKGYTLERKINGVILPATISIPGLDFKFDFDRVYGRFDNLTEEQRVYIKSLVSRLLEGQNVREGFIELIKKDRIIKDGRFYGMHTTIMTRGFRRELIDRLTEEGKFVYGSLGKELSIGNGPIPNGGANANPTGKVMTKGKHE